jgi:hypothetical protein
MLTCQVHRLGRSGLIKAQIFSGAMTFPVDILGSRLREAGIGAMGGYSTSENGHLATSGILDSMRKINFTSFNDLTAISNYQNLVESFYNFKMDSMLKNFQLKIKNYLMKVH